MNSREREETVVCGVHSSIGWPLCNKDSVSAVSTEALSDDLVNDL